MPKKQLLSITITAYRGNWQRFSARKRNQAFLAFQAKIFKRDKHRCRFCGFSSNKFLNTVNIDHNYSNNKAKNMATACSFCTQCFFIDAAGLSANSGGNIIFLPEITQADLNHFCRALFTSMTSDTPYRGKLQSCYLSLQDRGKILESLLGPGSADARIFGQALLDSNSGELARNHSLMQQLRFLPDRSKFSKETTFWKQNVFKDIPL